MFFYWQLFGLLMVLCKRYVCRRSIPFERVRQTYWNYITLSVSDVKLENFRWNWGYISSHRLPQINGSRFPLICWNSWLLCISYFPLVLWGYESYDIHLLLSLTVYVFPLTMIKSILLVFVIWKTDLISVAGIFNQFLRAGWERQNSFALNLD